MGVFSGIIGSVVSVIPSLGIIKEQLFHKEKHIDNDFQNHWSENMRSVLPLGPSELIFQEGILADGGCAIGLNWRGFSPPIIQIPKPIVISDKEAAKFVCKHEVGHILHHDLARHISSLLVGGFVMGTRCSFKTSCLMSVIACLGAGWIASKLYQIHYETQADDFALAHATNEELLGARRLLKAELQIGIIRRFACNLFANQSIDECPKFLRILYKAGALIHAPSGDFRLNFSHPSSSSRLAKVENALSQRSVHIPDYSEESEKIEKIALQLLDHGFLPNQGCLLLLWKKSRGESLSPRLEQFWQDMPQLHRLLDTSASK